MFNHTLRVAIYARVSGEQQVKDDTIASQLEALTQRVASDGLDCEPELCFVDDGYTGDILVRPGLERLRDQAAAGAIDRVYMLDPDRFSRAMPIRSCSLRSSPAAVSRSSSCATRSAADLRRICSGRSRA